MAFTSPMTAVSGATFTAAQFNTNVRDNLNAIWVGTTANDMEYYTSATAKARLAAPTVNSNLNATSAGVISWVSNTRVMGFLLNTDIALNTGDDCVRFRIPSIITGWNIISAAASRKSGTGILTIQLRNVTDAVDVFSTKLTVDSGETDSSTAATPVVINTSNDDVATADQFAIDIDVAGTATLYAFVEIGYRKP